MQHFTEGYFFPILHFLFRMVPNSYFYVIAGNSFMLQIVMHINQGLATLN